MVLQVNETTGTKAWRCKRTARDFPGGPVVKDLPSKAGDAGSIPSQGTKILPAMGQPSLSAAATESTCSRVCALKLESPPTARKTQHSCPPNKEKSRRCRYYCLTRTQSICQRVMESEVRDPQDQVGGGGEVAKEIRFYPVGDDGRSG